MNWFLLYLLLLKATITSFSGLASVPIIRHEMVVNRHLLSDDQLNTSIVVGNSVPGPNGIYVVSVGYFAGGVPGAVAGWLALSTPALLVIPMVYFVGRKAEHPRLKAVLQAVILASSGLLLSSTVALARSTITNWTTAAIALAAALVLLFRRVDTLWVIAGAAACSLALSAFGG